MTQFVIQNDTLRLRKTTLTDLDFVLEAENAEANRAFVGQWTELQHRAALGSRRTAHLMAETVADSQPVGYLILTDLKDASQSLSLKRIVITAKGNGYGRAALQLVKKLAFERLNTHRLWLDVKDFNVRARHLYASEGFVQEGILRECLKNGDKFESLVIMSVLRSEYQIQSPSSSVL